MKKKVKVEVEKEEIFCDYCEDSALDTPCIVCEKDVCEKHTGREEDTRHSGNLIICSNCFNKLPEFAKENLRIIIDEHDCMDDCPEKFKPEFYKKVGYYVYFCGEEADESHLEFYEKLDGDSLSEIYVNEDGQSSVENIYDEKGNSYSIQSTYKLKKD